MHAELPAVVRCALAFLAALAPGLSEAASVLQARDADVPGCMRTEVLGADAELEARAARIGGIEFTVGDVFDVAGRDGDRALFRAANHLHPATREATLRAQLLFGPGELYRRRVLDETERSLRRLRYLYDAQLEPVRYHPASNAVDVRVCTRDVWTLSPGVSFGRGGGENSFGFEIEDYNVLGSGQSLTLARRTNVDRSTTIFSWNAPTVRGTRWQVSADYHISTDGGLRALDVSRPFYSLDSDATTRLYRAGEPAFEFAAARREAEVWLGGSGGLEGGWVQRYRVGWTFDERRFARLPESPLGGPAQGDLPPDRRLSYPWIGVQWIEDGYAETHDVDQIGRTEDMNLGFAGDVRAGVATTALGSDRDALVLEGAASWSGSLRPEQLLSVEAGLGTRVEDGGTRDTDAQLAARTYWRWSSRWMSFAGIETRWTRDLDPDQQVLLGGDNGLRGYPLRFVEGRSAALLTLEQRLFTAWEPLRLCRVGGAVFFDAGRTWGGLDAPDAGRWLKDVGVGLRLGNSRSSRGSVIHIDVAVPLDATDRVDGVQVLIKTKASF